MDYSTVNPKINLVFTYTEVLRVVWKLMPATVSTNVSKFTMTKIAATELCLYLPGIVIPGHRLLDASPAYAAALTQAEVLRF